MNLWEKIRAIGRKQTKKLNQNPDITNEKFLFVNNLNRISDLKIMEYNIWYEGDGDVMLNFYKGNMAVRYNYEPFFDENKRSYFWAVSATETDFKRTHSGLPRDIVDTLTNVVGPAHLSTNNIAINDTLQAILKDNNFDNMLKQVIIPMTLVEGWGCLKIDWDLNASDYPIIQHYRARDVEFIYKYKTRLVGVIYKDYYYVKGNTYVLLEHRELVNGSLVITKDMYQYQVGGNEDITLLSPKARTELFPNINFDTITVHNFNKLLSVPLIFFEDSSYIGYGRSIYTGKIDLFDDYDQALSIASIATRRATPKVYIDSEYLERDKDGFPVAPKEFDTKYVMYKGGKRGDGSNASQEPVKTEQPKLDYEQFQLEAESIAMHILTGIMSPATLGMDVSKKDNADAQREKEKVTIFTREAIMQHLGKELESLCEQCLDINTYLVAVQNYTINKGVDPETNEPLEQPAISLHDFKVSCTFDSFADPSFENKLTVLGNALSVDALSPEMFVEKLYGDTLTQEQKQKEIDYITEKKNPQDPMAGLGGFGEGEEPGSEPDEGESEEPLSAPGDNVTNEQAKDKSESDMKNKSYNRNNG